MTSTPSIHELFLQAIDLPPEQRADYVKTCTADPAVRERLGTLLDAHEESPGFLETAAIHAPIFDAPAETGVADVGGTIGRYKLLQQIGEGGFGAVYMAEQQEPVHRRVALKLIKLGMDTKQVIGRFEAERQALALMDHPNIAKVLDAGATESGRPYFVMELVKGIPITEYCDQHNLTVNERLALFQAVCNAVQHAHQKGIIHRDLKPTNILVTSHDGNPVPKVIDFGIAKAMHQKLTERTVFTEFRQFIGTPDYMSPEQADISGLDIDTRSDIYALGVLLYELLTGVTPFEPKKLRSAAYGEMQRIIREEMPPKPSTRLTALDTLDHVAAHRGSEATKLGALIRGELDWIVMRAMEKDRTRRYETANGLALDIERYLNDEPVVAGPPTASYRLRKFVDRNRGPVIVAAAVVLCLVTGLSATLVGLKVVADARRDNEILLGLFPPDTAIAVHLDNASGDPTQDYFVDGMTRALIGELERIDAIDVRSFETSAKIVHTDRTDAEIAKDLDVELLLSGRVQRTGDRVEMHVSLDHGLKNTNLMTESYSGEWSDVFEIQRQAAEDTLRAVHLEGQGTDRTAVVKKGATDDPRARDLYDRGIHNLMAPDGADLDRAVEFFDQALAIDSQYALAYLGKAKAYMAKAVLGVRPDDFNPPALDAARAAIAIDDSLSDAWAVLGQVQISYLYEWDEGRRSLHRSLAIDPDNPEAHIGMATSLITAGEFEVGIDHLKRAIEINPAILLTNEATSYLAFFARDWDLAIEICTHALDLDKDWFAPKAWLGLALGWQGESTRKAGIELLQEAYEAQNESPIVLACLAGLCAEDGQEARARTLLQELVDWSNARYVCPYEIATVFIALGEYDTAIEYLHNAVDASSECMPFIGTDIRLDPIRDDIDLKQIMRGIDHPLAEKPSPRRIDDSEQATPGAT
ncbi:MAG: protein kinase domain-containing protein [Planctomycetota bacterium]|jgi:serine/threonine protein kinase/TolB-like protein/tetratricopeptide (TPR) repeat protein